MTKIEKHPRDPELFRVGEVWYYRGTPKPGHGEVKKSLKVKSPGLAVQAKKDFLIGLRGLDLNRRGSLFKDVVTLILIEYERRIQASSPGFKEKAQKTKDHAENFLVKHLMPFFAHYTINKITEEIWGMYIQWCHERGVTRNLIVDRRFMLMCLHAAQRAGESVAIPKLLVPSFSKTNRRTMTPDEIKTLYDKATGILKPLILCMYKMGFRPGEVTGLRWDRVNFDRDEITLLEVDVKANARVMRMNAQVRAMLLERSRSETKGEIFVFPTRSKLSRKKGAKKAVTVGERPIHRYHKQWHRLLDDCEIDATLDPYCLRHTFLTECAKRVRGKTITTEEVVKFAGTSIREFERTYLHFTPEDTKEVAALMDDFGAI